MATIRDLARMTGVSTTTVSNVLNGKTGAASESKTQEIFAMADKLHYRANSFAKNLKLKHSSSIGIITEDLTVFNTPEIVNGIEEYCEQRGYEAILVNMRLFKRYHNDLTDTPEHAALFENIISNLLAKRVEGIIYIGYHCRKVSYYPPDPQFPFVYAYCLPANERYPAVLFDDRQAAQRVGEILIDKGHRKIGVICGPLTSMDAQSRLAGYQQALHNSGLSYDASTTFIGDWTRDSGYSCAKRLLDMNVTAIFAFNDMMASGVYGYCAERGLTVGRDITVFGYDDLDIASICTPALSSVQPDLDEMGHKSAELLLAQIRKESIVVQPYYLPSTVHIRASVTSPFNADPTL